jgi:pantoate--beta-alanine ligase
MCAVAMARLLPETESRRLLVSWLPWSTPDRMAPAAPSASPSRTPHPPVVRSVAELRDLCTRALSAASGSRGRVAFVPTMGALHRGHLALVEEALRRETFVVVSIFVNPTQFGPREDFSRYPRNLDADLDALAPLMPSGTGAVFAPEAAEMYPPGEETRVRVGALAAPLCGRFRPGHFEGVATVVAKLFCAAGPCTAVFGRKDYQQLLVVRRMARDLLLEVEVVGHPIVREADGLAMSSRNAYLSVDERSRALGLARGLSAAARAFAGGERDARRLEAEARAPVEAAATSIDYVEVRDAETLGALDGAVKARAVLAIACHVGSTRLIDNLVLGEDPPPLAP